MTGPQATRQLRRSRSTNSARPRQLHVEPLEDRRMLAGRAAEAINLFALDVYQHLQREQGNLFFSPLSIVTGLTMAYAGAAGQTADEMEQVLRLGEEPGIHEAFAELLDSIASHNESFAFPKLPHVLTVANAVWPDDDLTVEQGFLDVMQGQYDGHVQKVDYNDPQQAEKIINSWVNNQTKGKIDELVSDPSPFTRMVLTNAVYFNGYWQTPFDPRYSDEGSFTLPGGQAIVVPTMYTEQFTPYAVLLKYAPES